MRRSLEYMSHGLLLFLVQQVVKVTVVGETATILVCSILLLLSFPVSPLPCQQRQRKDIKRTKKETNKNKNIKDRDTSLLIIWPWEAIWNFCQNNWLDQSDREERCFLSWSLFLSPCLPCLTYLPWYAKFLTIQYFINIKKIIKKSWRWQKQIKWKFSFPLVTFTHIN